MSRECFARYLKLTRRALSDAAAIAAATAAGITSAGEPLQPLEELLQAAEAAATSQLQVHKKDRSVSGAGQLCSQPCLREEKTSL
jgi:hypothetical protein